MLKGYMVDPDQLILCYLLWITLNFPMEIAILEAVEIIRDFGKITF